MNKMIKLRGKKIIQKLIKIINFKNISIMVFLAGALLWGFLFWKDWKIQKNLLPVAGGSDMILRTQAINEAIKNGKNTYGFETNSLPMMPPEEEKK